MAGGQEQSASLFRRRHGCILCASGEWSAVSTAAPLPRVTRPPFAQQGTRSVLFALDYSGSTAGRRIDSTVDALLSIFDIKTSATGTNVALITLNDFVSSAIEVQKCPDRTARAPPSDRRPAPALFEDRALLCAHPRRADARALGRTQVPRGLLGRRRLRFPVVAEACRFRSTAARPSPRAPPRARSRRRSARSPSCCRTKEAKMVLAFF